MRKLFSMLNLLILLSACEERKNEVIPVSADSTVIDTVAVINDPMVNLNIKTSAFQKVDNSDYVMFPLSMPESGRRDMGKIGSSSYKEMQYGSYYWNIIFYNIKTLEYRLIDENRKMLIKNIEQKYADIDDAPAQIRDLIFYTITITDINQDKKLTNDDPEYLFISDKEGKNFRQISPDNCNLVNWGLVYDSSILLITVAKDSDKNKKFDEFDERANYSVNLDSTAFAAEIFSNDFKNKLKVLFDKNWKINE